MFGHKPDIISSRVMDYTYGIEMYGKYVENKYPVEKKLFRTGDWMVLRVFEVFVRVNEDVPVDRKVERTTTPTAAISTDVPVDRKVERTQRQLLQSQQFQYTAPKSKTPCSLQILVARFLVHWK